MTAASGWAGPLLPGCGRRWRRTRRCARWGCPGCSPPRAVIRWRKAAGCWRSSRRPVWTRPGRSSSDGC
ncbi:hypothetical protein V2I01_42190 [Micromonospora sp. BRA006-A]|nr:hypothetical protein [Micromonospora sp. BRA006-A]